VTLPFAGQSCLVTGAGSGIGAATAELLAGQGALITVVGAPGGSSSGGSAAPRCRRARSVTPGNANPPGRLVMSTVQSALVHHLR
jgi:NAD(P)-dependent dehydrogenase (short-subunit alcohol dehydrogenase family)